MNNLATYVSLDNLIQGLSHGKVELGLQVRSGSIVSMLVSGKKRLIYNSSNKDLNTNEKAIEDIARRLIQQLKSGVSSEITFKIKNLGNKIKWIEIESDQSINLNRTSSSVA